MVRNSGVLSALRLFTVIAVVCVFSRSAGATSISLSGNFGYQTSGSYVVLTADKVTNNSTGGTSGTLRMELWAFSSPFNGGSQSGYQLATYTLGQLSGGQYYYGISSGSVAYTSPPSGTWYMTLIVTEYNGGGWGSVAYGNFTNVVTCSGGVCTNGGTSTPTPTPVTTPTFTFTGSVVDGASLPVAGAQVYFVANGQTYSATTDASGRFTLAFNPTGIPSTVAYWVTKTGYIPLARNLTVSGSAANAGALALEALNGNAVLLEVVPDLHHLGDNSYSGSINSQFQKAGTEGAVFTRTFSLSASHLSNAGAQVTLLAKGLQESNSLMINGRLIGYLNSSPSDGSWGTITFQVAMSNLVAGSNTLQITSAQNYSGDYDDFEFTNVVIRFPPPSPNQALAAPPTSQAAYTYSAGRMPTAAVITSATGTFGSARISVTLDLSKVLGGGSFTGLGQFAAGYNVYVLALIPAGRLGLTSASWYMLPASGLWAPLGAPIAAYAQGFAQTATNQIVISILQGMDVTQLAGTEFYVGYGLSDEEMLAANRYRGVYKVQ